MTANYRLGLILVTASALAWSLTGFFTRLIPLDAWTTLFWRGVFGALGIAMVILWRQGRAPLAGFWQLGTGGWLVTGLSTLGMVCFIASLKLSSVAHVSIIYATVPFLAAGLGWALLREMPSRSAVAASLAALCGVGLTVGNGGDGDLRGDALALVMTACLAAIMAVARKWPQIPMLHAALLTTLVSAAIAWWPSSPLQPDGMQWLWLALFGLINSALGLALFSVGARHLPAMETALLGALDGALAPVWVWLAFAETPSPSTIAGGAIVFAAVAAHLWRAAGGRPVQASLAE